MVSAYNIKPTVDPYDKQGDAEYTFQVYQYNYSIADLREVSLLKLNWCFIKFDGIFNNRTNQNTIGKQFLLCERLVAMAGKNIPSFMIQINKYFWKF